MPFRGVAMKRLADAQCKTEKVPEIPDITLNTLAAEECCL